MKLGVIGGAGVMGSTAAYYAAMNNLVDEIVLHDLREDLAMSHAIDMDQGICEISGTSVTAGDFDALKGSDIILNTAGVPEGSLATKDEYLIANTTIFKGIAEKIKTWGYYPVIITASNPCDVLSFKLYEYLGGPRERYLGFSYNDNLRLKWSAAIELGLSPSNVDGLVLGEHGDHKVFVFSSLKRKDTEEAIVLSDEQKESVKARIRDWFNGMLALNQPRTMGWTSCIGLGMMIEAVATESETIIPCSCIPDGEYGLNGVSLALPLKLGREGLREIVDISLDADEKTALDAASDKIKSLIGKA